MIFDKCKYSTTCQHLPNICLKQLLISLFCRSNVKPFLNYATHLLSPYGLAGYRRT